MKEGVGNGDDLHNMYGDYSKWAHWLKGGEIYQYCLKTCSKSIHECMKTNDWRVFFHVFVINFCLICMFNLFLK